VSFFIGKLGVGAHPTPQDSTLRLVPDIISW
jgi:hypothetical protein